MAWYDHRIRTAPAITEAVTGSMSKTIITIGVCIGALHLPVAQGSVVFWRAGFASLAYDGIGDDYEAFEEISSPFEADHTVSVGDLSAHGMYSAVCYFLPDPDPVEVWSAYQYAYPMFSDYLPITGTLSIDGTFLLPAGGQYGLVFGAELRTDGTLYETQNLLNAFARMELTYHTVPEPATAGLLILGLGMVFRRRRSF